MPNAYLILTLFWLLGHVKNAFTNVNFKTHDATTYTTTIKMHILPNISRNKENQIMKFGQVMEYSRNIVLQGSCRKWGRETNSRPLFEFLKKALYEVKESGLFLSLNIFW